MTPEILTPEMWHVNRILVGFILFTLTLIRCGCLVVFAPFFSLESFPMQIRVGMAAGLALLLVPAASTTVQIPQRMDMAQLAILAGQELTVGLCIVFMASIVFAAVRMTGEIAGQQIGFSMANVVDPTTGTEVPILGFINNNIAMAIFVTAKLHLLLIYVLARSYDFIGIGAMVPEVNLNHPAMEMSVKQAQDMMVLGARLAIPVMLVMLLNSIVEGFVAKTMPQMNMQVLGIPLRVVLGITVLVYVYPAMCIALMPPDWQFNLTEMPEGPYGTMLEDLAGMVQAMGRDSGGY